MHNERKAKRLPKAVVSLFLALVMAFGSLSPGLVLTASAASPPALQIATGTPYFYSVSGKNPGSVKYGTATAAPGKMTVSQSGSTITFQETEKNKLYELGYVPIVTSLMVPAETTLYATLSFTLSGNKNGSGSAIETMELFSFGGADKSSKLTFKTTENSDGILTKASVRNDGSSMATSYTVAVTYQNTATTEQKICQYFGFFAGVHYGSSKNHKLSASCTITYGKITTDKLSAKINFDEADARVATIGGNTGSTATISKDKFVPDVAYSSLTQEQKDIIESLTGYRSGATYHAGLSATEWSSNRLYVRRTYANSYNKLEIYTEQEPSRSGMSKLAYTPFTVPLTVPAHTTRTFYLTFEISYTRGTGSGAGFFAELIDGDVPSAFNTSAKATPTGNTKLRVYSDSGKSDTEHTGTVELPVTLTNDTDSAKTFEKSYVFFAGHRVVGAYTPRPDFRLELKSIVSSRYEDTYHLVIDASHCTVTAPASVSGFTQISATVAAHTGYALPNAVTVTVGGKTLAASKYTYNRSRGTLSIPAGYVRDNISIAVQATPRQYSITYQGLEGATLSAKPTVHTYGSPTAVGNPTKTGYTFSGWKINSGTAAKKNLTLGATDYTGSITLTATWAVNTYSVTLVNSTNVSAASGFGSGKASYGTAWSGKIKAASGYELPDRIAVSVGGKALTASQYTYSRSTGSVTVSAPYVTGNIVISATGVLIEIVSVDITWGSMEFSYSDGTWNPATHTYQNGGWTPGGGATASTIFVQNKGNISVNVSFSYAAKDRTVSVTFRSELNGSLPAVVTGPIALPAGKSKQVSVSLEGKPTGNMATAVLGTITVTIGGE